AALAPPHTIPEFSLRYEFQFRVAVLFVCEAHSNAIFRILLAPNSPSAQSVAAVASTAQYRAVSTRLHGMPFDIEKRSSGNPTLSAGKIVCTAQTHRSNCSSTISSRALGSRCRRLRRTLKL